MQSVLIKGDRTWRARSTIEPSPHAGTCCESSQWPTSCSWISSITPVAQASISAAAARASILAADARDAITLSTWLAISAQCRGCST